MELNRPDLVKILEGYNVDCYGVETASLRILTDTILAEKKTGKYIKRVLESDRYPSTIVKVANEIGMFIPYGRRYSLESYNHFLENIGYYENVSGDHNTLDLYDVYISTNPIEILKGYRDDDLMKTGYEPGNNRNESLQKFVKKHLDSHGRFTLDSNIFTPYSSKCKSVTYNGVKYSVSEVDANIKNGTFSHLALHELRQRILEKLEGWRCMNKFNDVMGPPELITLLYELESILEDEPRPHLACFLGNPEL